MTGVADGLFAGIDAGTTGVTVAVFDASGREVSSAYQEYSCSYPHPGWIEQDLDEVWRGICVASQRATAALGPAISQLRSIGFSSQRGSFVLLGDDLRPLGPAVVWNDSRAKEMEEHITRHIDAARYRAITGMPVSGSWAVAKLMWLQANAPRLMDRTRWICNGQEYFLHRLGVDGFETDAASLTLNGMMDIAALDWSDEILAVAGIDRSLLPPVGPSGVEVGRVSPEAAEATGIPVGTPLCRGAGDQQCAAVGAGVISQGMAEVTIGTAAMMVAHLESIDLVDGPAPYVGAHAVPGKWDLEGGAFAIGAALRWWRDNFADAETASAHKRGVSPYEVMIEQALSAPAGASGLIFHPFLAGQMTPFYDTAARGAFLGLGLQHDKASMIRSVLEGCACEIRLMVEGIERDLSGGLTDLRLTGGGTRSRGFTQLIASLLGRPVQLLSTGECTVLGAAILGARGVGAFASIEEAVDAMVSLSDEIEPDRAIGDLYDALFEQFTSAFKAQRQSGLVQDIYDYQSRWFE